MNVWWRVADYRDYEKDGGKGTRKQGVLTISLKSWDDFNDAAGLLLKHGDFIWRGQRQDWPLLPKFQRVVKAKKRRRGDLKKLTKTFEQAIKGRRGTNPPTLEDDIAVWSLGQHYGLPTPLLDWTKSPFVAAYFAFCEKRSKGDLRYRAIYGLSWDIQRWGPATSRGGKPEAFFIRIHDEPSDENPRLLSQRGCFTVPLTPDIEIAEAVRQCYSADIHKGVRRIILVKIKIPEAERTKCLRNLNIMNINSATLFPDLQGAAGYCAMKLDVEEYD